MPSAVRARVPYHPDRLPDEHARVPPSTVLVTWAALQVETHNPGFDDPDSGRLADRADDPRAALHHRADVVAHEPLLQLDERPRVGQAEQLLRRANMVTPQLRRDRVGPAKRIGLGRAGSSPSWRAWGPATGPVTALR